VEETFSQIGLLVLEGDAAALAAKVAALAAVRAPSPSPEEPATEVPETAASDSDAPADRVAS
jgi:hypothetical protein